MAAEDLPDLYPQITIIIEHDNNDAENSKFSEKVKQAETRTSDNIKRSGSNTHYSPNKWHFSQ